MKKIVAFISSLLVVLPSFAQDNSGSKDKNKPHGVSKVKQQDVNKAPASSKAAPANAAQKNAGHIKLSSNQQKAAGATTTGQQKQSGSQKTQGNGK